MICIELAWPSPSIIDKTPCGHAVHNLLWYWFAGVCFTDGGGWDFCTDMWVWIFHADFLVRIFWCGFLGADFFADFGVLLRLQLVTVALPGSRKRASLASCTFRA